MSKWDGCPVISCKNDLCDRECQHQKRQKELAIATTLSMSDAEWAREKEMAEGMNSLNPRPLPR